MNPAILSEQKFLLAAGYDPGPLDGIDGPRTQRARLAYQAAARGSVQRASDSSSAKLYAEACKYIEIHEQPGPGTHPIIAQAFALAPDWLNQDDSITAWCALIRGLWGHRTATGLPKDHYRAAAWLDWGKPVDEIKDAVKGDTIVFTRPGGNHVALFDNYDLGARTVHVLGGNQSNAVTLANYNVSAIRGIRRS